MRTLFSLFLICIFFSANAQLEVDAGLKRQLPDSSYSKYNFTLVGISSGPELNKGQKKANFDTSSDYLLYYDEMGDLYYIRLKQPLQSEEERKSGNPLNKTSFEYHCQSFGYNTEGTDQNGIRWKICFFKGMTHNACY